METALTSGLKDLEGRLASRHRELETSLEDEIRRNGVKLEDLDDRYSRSEEALRSAEERIGEVQEEVRCLCLLLCTEYEVYYSEDGVLLKSGHLCRTFKQETRKNPVANYTYVSFPPKVSHEFRAEFSSCYTRLDG